VENYSTDRDHGDVCIKLTLYQASYIDCDYKKAIVETVDFRAEHIQKMAYSLNIELNLVENSDFRLSNYQNALIGF
jgi:anaerobic magnesium-protoporphyrin IX monomethyl ester cyclase